MVDINYRPLTEKVVVLTDSVDHIITVFISAIKCPLYKLNFEAILDGEDFPEENDLN